MTRPGGTGRNASWSTLGNSAFTLSSPCVGREITAIVPERTHEGLTETIALRRFGSACEAAYLVAFLLSGESCAITGTVLEVPSPIFA